MHSRNSEEKQPSTSQQVHYPIQSSVSLESRSKIICNDPHINEKKDSSKFDVPGDSSCLYWAVTLAYLIPVKDDDVSFQMRYNNLFGNDETTVKKLACVRTSIQNYNPLSHKLPQDGVLEHLVRYTFRSRVVDFIESNIVKFEHFPEVADENYRFNMRNSDIWSGEPEIQAISLLLDCSLKVDEQTFPLVSITKNVKHNLKKVTLELFHMNRLAGGDNHYNYGLEKRFLDYFREKLLDTTFKLLEKYFREKTEKGMQGNAEHDYNNPGNNSLENSKESDIGIRKSNAEDIANAMDNNVVYRINNEVKCEAVCEHELSKILDKYEDCKQANQPVNKDSFQKRCGSFRLFQNPKHVAGIFGTLKNIAENNELLKYVFLILKIVIDELYNNGNYDRVILIADIKEVNFVKNIFYQKDISDLDVLQFQRIVAQAKNKKCLYEDALKILYSIVDKIMHAKGSTASDKPNTENIDSYKFYFSLLISSDIAFTKHMMGKCEESYKEYKALHDKVMRHLGLYSEAQILSYKLYKDILKSGKYQTILALDAKYLNILHIRSNIAHELTCLGFKMRNNLLNNDLKDYVGALNKAVQCYQDAINLYENNFEINRIGTEFCQEVGTNIRDAAVVYSLIGSLKAYKFNVERNVRNEMLNEALHYYFMSFEMYAVNLTSPELWTTHPINSKFVRNISFVLYTISWIHKECGYFHFLIDPKAALRSFEKALNSFEKSYKLKKNMNGKEHKHTLGDQYDIAFINTKIGYLKSRHNPEEATTYYEKAYEIYKELLEIKSLTGKNVSEILKIKSHMNKTRTRINELKIRI